MQGLLIFINLQTFFMSDKNKRDERPEAYPRPSKTDKQLQNQPEFIDNEPEMERGISNKEQDTRNIDQETRNKEQGIRSEE